MAERIAQTPKVELHPEKQASTMPEETPMRPEAGERPDEEKAPMPRGRKEPAHDMPSHPTAQTALTTLQKVPLSTEYAVTFTVKKGEASCTIDPVDAMHAWAVAGDKPGEALIVIAPQAEDDPHAPALVQVTVNKPPTVVTIGTPEPK